MNSWKNLIPSFFLKRLLARKKAQQSKGIDGNVVECPICKSSYARFNDFGNPKRENAQCANCKSLERHRLLYLFLESKFDLFNKNQSSKKLLHFAPKKIFYSLISSLQTIEYVPCDLSPERYQIEGSTPVQKVDILSIPFEENTFDLILCNHVLEHIEDDQLAMSELYRVMQKNGIGIFQVPIDSNREKTYEDFAIQTPAEREKAFGQKDHVRMYGLDYKARLENAGFNVKLDSFVDQYSKEDQYKYGLMPHEVIYVCTKV